MTTAKEILNEIRPLIKDMENEQNPILKGLAMETILRKIRTPIIDSWLWGIVMGLFLSAMLIALFLIKAIWTVNIV